MMVMKILYKSLFKIRYDCRHYSVKTPFQVEQLPSRALLKISGIDIFAFLQGLITNDINSLNRNGLSMFTFFLNNRGRVLYDSLIYRKSENELILECDSTIRNELINHLKIYRVRKKIDIESLDENVWVVFNESHLKDPLNRNLKDADKFSVCNPPNLKSDPGYQNLFRDICQDNRLYMFGDPRMYLLGVRVFGASENVAELLLNKGFNVTMSQDYIKFRYKLGIAEGIHELPPGNCFPLEANADYLHGVSFHKGCYVGQELTARTHHTGVVRKRLMPLILSSVPEGELKQDYIIETEDGKKVGKLRGIHQEYAIALLRITECLQNATKLKISGTSASTYKPFWWPQEQNSENNLADTS